MIIFLCFYVFCYGSVSLLEDKLIEELKKRLFIFFLQVATQSQYGIGLGIKREVFFLNLEDGYFGCQVNESTQILQLYELSKLCDGVSDCYKGSDELKSELKCTGETN